MSIELREFEVEDARKLYATAIDPRVRKTSIEEYMRIVESHTQKGPAFTALYEGEVIYSWGMWVGERHSVLWGMFSPAITKCTKSVLKSLKFWLAFVIEQYDVKKVWAVAVTSSPATGRLLKHLGLEFVRFHKDEELFLMKV